MTLDPDRLAFYLYYYVKRSYGLDKMILMRYHYCRDKAQERQMDEKRCKVEVFSRVTGFFRPVQTWNNGKMAEFIDRRKFHVIEGDFVAPEKETGTENKGKR